MPDTASDTRSVIKNATQWWLLSKGWLSMKKWKWAVGKGNTIATKEEITTQKTDSNLNPKPTKQTTVSTNTATKKTATKSPMDMVAESVNTVSKNTTQWIIPSNQQSVGTFQNSTVQPIENIKISQMDGKDVKPTENTKQDDKFINQTWRATELKAPIDVEGALGDLYLDVKAKVKNWTLSASNIEMMKQVYPEFSWLWDDVIKSLLWDLWSMVKKGLTLNDTNMEKLKELYPELTSAAWWFATPDQQNMYQAWWVKEAMSSASVTDLNRYGTAWAVAEWVLNPIWEGTTLLDAASQTIWQVDDNTDKILWFIDIKSTPELKKALQWLSEKDIEWYYQRYQNFIKEHPTLAKWYTRQLIWNNTVSKLWNYYVKDKYIEDADAWFRSWLIDQVNNEVNGWQGELWGAWAELKWVWWPNIAKMYANLPASTVKTVTAIGRAITNPVDTWAWLGLLIKDGWENYQNWTFSQSIIWQRYWSWDAFAKAMEQDPVWVASDLLAVAEIAGWSAGTVSKATRWWTRNAALTTYALWAEKTSQNLFKISNRLKQFEWKINAFKNTAWWASDMWLRQVFYWLDGKWWLVGWLEKWAAEWDAFSNKAAKYLSNHMTVNPWITAAKNLLNPTKAIAEGITWTKSAEGKLLQAANPNTNKLTKWVDYANKKANMDTATRAIVEAWYTPKNLAEWADAHLKTLNKLWNEFTAKVKDKADVTVDATKVVESTQKYLDSLGEDITVNQRSDVRALQREIDNLKQRGKINMQSLENFKESFNAETRNKTHTAKWDIYIRWLKELSKAIGEIQNEMLSKAPDEVKILKKKIGALLDTKEDVQKANLKQQKRKEGGGLIENYGRISGLWDIIWWAFNTVTGKWGEGIAQMGKWVWKLVLWKALGKAKDVDFLTEKWFEWLKKKVEAKNWVKNKDKTTKKWDKSDKEWVKFKKDTKKKSVSDTDEDYADALNAAYRKNKKGEREITENKNFTISEDSKVYKDIAPKAKNVGFVTRIVDNMKKALEQAGEWDVEWVRAFTDFRKKLINLSKNPWDTTLQHEFFHSVMKVLDPRTRDYVLNQAKKFLSQELWRRVGDIAAEEWLAESFGVYIRDKMVDLGIIERAKGIEWLKQRIKSFYQRAYEFMQNYNIDRYTLNDIFNEIYNGDYRLNDKWVLDLSYLWDKWLGKKRNLWGWKPVKWGNNPKWWVAFKKDTWAAKYKADINWKSVDIDTKATSPDQLAKINTEWLSVMKSFISEKQAKKALDVSKELLTKDGDAYLWTHTNKYDNPQFAAFENMKDSKYKEFADNEIAFFSNSEEMSKSYAKGQSKLANTKPYKNVEDFNKNNLTVEKSTSKQKTRSWVEIPTKVEITKWDRIIEGKSWKARIENVVENKRTLDTSLDKLLDDMEVAREWYTWDSAVWEESKTHPLTRDERITRLKWLLGGQYSWGKWDVNIKELPNWKVEVLRSKNNILKEEYANAKQAMAEFTASKTESAKYHYQGIIQNMKKPLVVDLWKKKYWLKDWKTWEEFNTGRGWNDLWTAYELLERENKEGLKNLESVSKKFSDTFWKLTKERKDFITRTSDLRWQYSKKYDDYWYQVNWKMDEKNADKIRQLDSDMANALNASHSINQYLNWEIKEINPDIMDWIKKHDDYTKVYNEVVDFVKKNEDTLPYISYGNNRKDFQEWLVKNWLKEDVASLLHNLRLSGDSDIIEWLKDKDLETNDYVFYALRNWNYDWVIFKDILDFGSNDAFDKAANKGWDVLVAFNSKQFKAWDNANPTDSKYISYKKDTKGLQEKDKLIWLHNLGIEKLKGAVELGWMPMPSIAVTKAWVPHTSYGDITFIMKESAVNPKLNRKNRLYTVDGYTPTQQQPVIRIKNTKEADALISKIEKETWMSYGEVSQWLEYHDDRYVEQYPKLKQFEKYYDDLTEKKLFDGYTYSGKRRYIDYNLDNIVKKMVGNKRDAFNGAFWKMVAQSEWSTTVDKLRERNFWLKDKEAAEKLGEKYYDALRDLASKKWIEQKIETLSDYWRFAENVSDAYRPSTEAWWKELTQWDGAEWTIYSKITKEDLEPLQKIVKEWAQMPRPYSEAKPERAIRWNEVGAAIAPEDKIGEVKELLKDTWVEVYPYKWEDRMKVVDEVADAKGLKFKKDTNSDWKKLSEWQMEYFKDSKVRDKFGRLTPVYHFTADDFNTVDFKKGSQNLFWFTSDGTASDRAQGVRPGMQRKRKDMYVDIKNPAGWEEYNKFWTDELKYRGYDGVILKNRDWSFEGFIFDKENQVKYTDNLNPTSSKDMRFKKWYHGSKSEFSNFDSSHMGEWEGAQAHGWWHYIAMEKDTAKKYAQMGASNTYFKWKPLDEFFKSEEGKTYSKVEKEAIKKVAEYVPDYTPEEAIEVLPDDLRPAKTDFDKAVIRAIQNLDPDDFKPGRHLYEVDFKDPGRASTPSKWNYLDEETPYARKTFDKIFDEAKKAWWNESKVKDYIDRQLAFNGEDKMYGVWIRKALDMWFGDDSWKKTSKFLESLWYEWIHYKGLEDGEAYVIFKDTNPRITSHVMYKKDTKGLWKKQDTDSWLRYKKARHWSPADFDRFDSSHMGEGEWAQAHWWGHYVAVSRDTAKNYADMWWRNEIWYKWKKSSVIAREIIDAVFDWKPSNREEGTANMILSKMNMGEDFKTARKHAIENLENLIKDYEKEGGREAKIKELRWDIEQLNKLDETNFTTIYNKHIYELDIPDPVKRDTPTGSNYLEEEWLMSAISVQEFMDAFRKKYPEKADQFEATIRSNAAPRYGEVEWWEMYRYLDDALGWQKQASKFLESLWYDGIHYVWKQDWEAYVLFSDDAPKIQNHIRYKKDTNWLAKKSNWLQKKENSDIRYKLTKMWFTPTRKLTVSEVDDIKGKKYWILATYDKKTAEDTLKTVKQVVKSDLNKDVKDGFKIRRDDMKHAYISHWYDTELWYWRSITKKDFENVPDILENYDNIEHFTVLDKDWYLVDRYKLYKDYWNERQYLVLDVNDLSDGKSQVSFKTMYINDAQWRAKYKADEKAWVIRQKKQQARKQYWDRFHL